MDVGVYIDAHMAIGPAARMVEEAGFDAVWVYDSPLVFGDVWMALAEAARATERVTIGPGVTHPHARSPVATAQALGTLASAAPGRVALGLGIGNSARRSLGQPPARRQEMREYSEAVRTLLAGGAIDAGEGGAEEVGIRFIHPRGRWLELSRQPEHWVSAFGPKGQRLAGEYADAVFVRWEGAAALAAARERIASGAAAAGREPGTVKLATVFAVYPIDSEDELEAEEARRALGPLVVSRLRYLTANHSDASEVPEHFRAGFEEYRRYREELDPQTRHLDNYEGYLVFTPSHLERFVTPDSMRSVALVGSSAEVAAELGRMRDCGVAHASLQIVGPPPRWCERMHSEVLPTLR